MVPGFLVAIINHKGNVFVPGWNDRFLEGDTVVLVTTTGKKIDSLNDVLSVK
jgi:hypothetical protein